jgi:flagellar L-ring protein precursor FlgH
MKKHTFAILMGGLILACPNAYAQIANPSLYSDSAPHLFLFRDLKARNVNDIVTIQIVESSSASNSANTSTKKEGDVSISAPALGGLEHGASALNFSNILRGASSLSFAGQGSTSRTGQLQASLSARVIEVMPNGDLAIEGTKEVTINRERQILTIRGLVRSRDVTPFNVVSSTAIANMEVKFDGKGIVSDANKPGFLYRFFQLITPF